MLPIFLVEDDPAIRQQLIAALDGISDAQVIATVATQKDASHWLKSHAGQWHLVVLDLYLSEGTGFGILEGIETPHERDQVIVLTNSASAGNRARCMGLGAHAVFDKTTELDAFLDYCLRHPRQVLEPN